MEPEDHQHQGYLKRRDELIRLRENSIESFDKTVLTLSTGGLALSVTFIEKIGRPNGIGTFSLITLYWISCLVVITVTLFSFHYAEKNMTHKIADLDERYEKGTLFSEPERVFPERRKTEFCNLISRTTFAIGVLFFMAYVILIQFQNYRQLSIQQEDQMAKQVNGGLRLREGLTEAPMARQSRMDGLTEVKMAIAMPKGATKGLTETPMAVAHPVAQQAQGSTGGSANQGGNAASDTAKK